PRSTLLPYTTLFRSRAKDPSNYEEVILYASEAAKYEELIKYLKMCRDTLREPPIDSALVLSYARLDNLHDLKDFLDTPNVADLRSEEHTSELQSREN